MAKKGYNRLNFLEHCKIIIDIVNARYKVGYTTYAGIFRTFVKPFYPMSYHTFMKIINMPNVEKLLKEEHDRMGKPYEPKANSISNQMDLFETV